MSGLYVENLSAGYGKRILWKNLTFSVEPGEICILMGENGSGKTTLIRTLQGAISPQTGGIFWEEAGERLSLATLSVRKRASILTAMPQELPDTPGLLASDYLKMGFYHRLGPFGVPTKEDYTTIRTLAERYGVTDLLSSYLIELSAGQRQMLSLLRCLVQNTPVLLLDEPSSALDFGHGEALIGMIRQIASEGKAILAVLHDPTMAIRLGTRLLCLADGELFCDISNPVEYLSETEQALRKLYPNLRIHKEPLLCYSELPEN